MGGVGFWRRRLRGAKESAVIITCLSRSAFLQLLDTGTVQDLVALWRNIPPDLRHHWLATDPTRHATLIFWERLVLLDPVDQTLQEVASACSSSLCHQNGSPGSVF